MTRSTPGVLTGSLQGHQSGHFPLFFLIITVVSLGVIDLDFFWVIDAGGRNALHELHHSNLRELGIVYSGSLQSPIRGAAALNPTITPYP
jgi:hypothetical protein